MQIPKYIFNPTLDVEIFDIYKLEAEIEKDLKSKVAKFRKSIYNVLLLKILGMDIKTNFDIKLGYLITPALVNYELERIANQTYGNDEFKQSVKNIVPEGYTFKAFPLHSIDKDTDKIFGLILSSDVIIFNSYLYVFR